jgi:hypothetical protein
LGDLGIDVSVIGWNGFIWLRIGFNFGNLRTQ